MISEIDYDIIEDIHEAAHRAHLSAQRVAEKELESYEEVA